MINNITTIINVSDSVIILKVSLESLSDLVTLTLNLDNITPDTSANSIELAQSLDWSQAIANTAYHLENNVLTKTPPQPGLTYKFDYVANVWRDTRTLEQMWDSVKTQRNNLLNQSDWTQMLDVAIATKSQWAIYRQQLRDITQQTDPYNIVWPQPPGA
jgi:hypothetical protein